MRAGRDLGLRSIGGAAADTGNWNPAAHGRVYSTSNKTWVSGIGDIIERAKQAGVSVVVLPALNPEDHPFDPSLSPSPPEHGETVPDASAERLHRVWDQYASGRNILFYGGRGDTNPTNGPDFVSVDVANRYDAAYPAHAQSNPRPLALEPGKLYFRVWSEVATPGLPATPLAAPSADGRSVFLWRPDIPGS
jgi:hypothetical protein